MKKLFKSISTGLLLLMSVPMLLIAAVEPDIRLRSDNDHSRINSREKFMQQWNAGKIIAVEESNKIADQNQNVSNSPMSEEVQEWMNYVDTLSITNERKQILFTALACIERGVIYHQLRGGTSIRAECTGNCGCETETEIHPLDNGTYTFAAHGQYNIDAPIYLDCSYFVKHCYWKAGIEFSYTSTREIYGSSEWSTITAEQLEPGDVAVKKGHITIYVTTNEEGIPVWIEMGNHADDCKISAYQKNNEYIYRRLNKLYSSMSGGNT